MKRQNTTIGLLSLSAIALFVACLFSIPQQKAEGIVTIKDRDYQVATTPLSKGGDALYIIDNRTGQLVVFYYDIATQRLQFGAGRDLVDMFPR